MREIDPTALVAAGARLGAGVRVGAYAVIEEGVDIGAGCYEETSRRAK